MPSKINALIGHYRESNEPDDYVSKIRNNTQSRRKTLRTWSAQSLAIIGYEMNPLLGKHGARRLPQRQKKRAEPSVRPGSAHLNRSHRHFDCKAAAVFVACRRYS